MKKLLFFFALLFMGAMTAFAQVPANEQLTYQTVVRNAQNQLVIDQAGITVKVYVCSDAAGSNVVYSETHTGLSTNANGMLSMMIGSVAPDVGTWAGINWSEAYIKTTISYGSVTINSDPAPVTAVPYALQAGNSSNITNIISDAIHDSITNNISAQIHDSIVNNINNNISEQIHDSIVYNIENTISTQIHDSLTNALSGLEIQNCDDVNDCVANAIADGTSAINHAIDTVATNITNSILTENNYVTETVMGSAIHDSIPTNVSAFANDANYVSTTNLCTTIESECDNVPLKNGNNTFTGANDFTGGSVTVPNAVTPDLTTALASACTQDAVSLCDLLAVFDSLNRRLNSVYDSLARLANELEELRNSIPPAANAPTVSDVSSTSMKVTAHATSDGAAITSYEFCISTSSDMSGATCQTVQASDADNYTFTGLTPNTNYYVQYKATNFAGTTASSSVQQRTPAHAPTAIVNTPESAKPTCFKVEVTEIDPKEKDDATTVQVCYTEKTGGECPNKESADYVCADPQDVSTPSVTTNTQTITGLTPSTAYCAIVKVSNGDSTTIYGPYTVTTGEDVTLTVTRDPSTATVSLCGASSVPVIFTATPSSGNAGDYTYSWSAGISTTNKDTVTYTVAGTYIVTVTATHTTKGYTVTGTASVTIASGGTAATLSLCENRDWGEVTVRSTNCTSLSWVSDATGLEVSTSTTALYESSTILAGAYTVTGVNASDCSVTRHCVLGNYNPKPCTAASRGSHNPQVSGTNGYDGIETVNVLGDITSVQDIDGNGYPVVQIGSQCWMALNLRTTRYPNGNEIAQTYYLMEEDYGEYYLDYENSVVPFELRGYLYTWQAAKNACPTGWHLPTKEEWQTMIDATDATTETPDYYGTANAIGAVYFSSSCYWVGTVWGGINTSTEGMTPDSYENPNRNNSGFSAVPAGCLYGSRPVNSDAIPFDEPSDVGGGITEMYEGNSAYFWTASTFPLWNNYAWYRELSDSRNELYERYGINHFGLSVRCVRD